MVNQDAPALPELRARLHDAMAERGLAARQVVLRLPRQSMPTVYRIFAGTTRDPLTSTLLALCRTIDMDLDELLDARRPALEPEAEALLEQAKALDEADRWLLVRAIRCVTGHRAAEAR